MHLSRQSIQSEECPPCQSLPRCKGWKLLAKCVAELWGRVSSREECFLVWFHSSVLPSFCHTSGSACCICTPELLVYCCSSPYFYSSLTALLLAYISIRCFSHLADSHPDLCNFSGSTVKALVIGELIIHCTVHLCSLHHTPAWEESWSLS